MSNAHSNPMSDYDFAEFPDQINEENEILNSVHIQRMEPAMLTVLSGYNLDNEVLERFASSSITYSQLSALDNDDLMSLGVSDDGTIEDMLSEFGNLEGQDVHLASLLRSLRNPEKAARQETSVIDMIQNQLVSMNTLLAATILKVGASKSMQSPGVVINNKFASPDAVFSMLQKMSSHAEAMMKLITKLKDEAEVEKQENPNDKLKGIAWNSLLIVSGIVIGFCVFKQLRHGKKF